MLHTMGRLSTALIGNVAVLAGDRPWLAKILSGSGCFLDIGTGVAAIAIAAMRAWPGMLAVGIDIWPPALALARAGIADAGLAGRIALREQNVLDLPDRNAFDLVWLPTMFMPADIVKQALALLLPALAPGGCVIVGMFAIPDDPSGAELARLRIMRGGGHPWRQSGLAAQLTGLGYADVETPPSALGTTEYVLGRRPYRSAAT
jgi:SAM-dependent methyltransferase